MTELIETIIKNVNEQMVKAITHHESEVLKNQSG